MLKRPRLSSTKSSHLSLSAQSSSAVGLSFPSLNSATLQPKLILLLLDHEACVWGHLLALGSSDLSASNPLLKRASCFVRRRLFFRAFMDQKNNVRVVEEEEKSGWTLLSTVHDGELGEKLSVPPEADPELNKGSDDSVGAADDSVVSEENNKEENEDSDDADEVLYREGDHDADDELTDGVDEGGEGGEEEAFHLGDTARDHVWESQPVSVKQTLVEEQAGQKQGLVWRVSLVATLGFFGWAVLSGLWGGGKNIRCLKLHPCSLKEGEPVLSTL